MNVLQAWLIVGVPALALVAGLFAGRSELRALVGYVVLAATLVFFLLATGDVISGAAIGLIGMFLVAAGRGTHLDRGQPEHHEDRRRYTTDPSEA